MSLTAGRSAVVVETIAWGEQVPKVVLKEKKRGEQPLVHPFFLEYIKYTNDPFWIDLLKAASVGKLPKKFTLRVEGGVTIINHKKGSKIFNCYLSSDYFASFTNLVQFLGKYGGIVSEIDNMNSMRDESEMQAVKSAAVSTWSNTKQSNRTALTAAFIDTVAASHSLTREEKKAFKHFLTYNILISTFNKRNIHLSPSGREITNIEGLEWDPKTRRFFTYLIPPKAKSVTLVSTPYPCSHSSSLRTKYEPVSHFAAWGKFITGIATPVEPGTVPEVTIKAHDDEKMAIDIPPIDLSSSHSSSVSYSSRI